jgi:hypothetical protein
MRIAIEQVVVELDPQSGEAAVARTHHGGAASVARSHHDGAAAVAGGGGLGESTCGGDSTSCE